MGVLGAALSMGRRKNNYELRFPKGGNTSKTTLAGSNYEKNANGFRVYTPPPPPFTKVVDRIL